MPRGRAVDVSEGVACVENLFDTTGALGLGQGVPQVEGGGSPDLPVWICEGTVDAIHSRSGRGLSRPAGAGRGGNGKRRGGRLSSGRQCATERGG